MNLTNIKNNIPGVSAMDSNTHEKENKEILIIGTFYTHGKNLTPEVQDSYPEIRLFISKLFKFIEYRVRHMLQPFLLG